jgi:hypothetical protein
LGQGPEPVQGDSSGQMLDKIILNAGFDQTLAGLKTIRQIYLIEDYFQNQAGYQGPVQLFLGFEFPMV